jgi:signal transduction histidine kinase/CheY-like chemotaxis protein
MFDFPLFALFLVLLLLLSILTAWLFQKKKELELDFERLVATLAGLDLELIIIGPDFKVRYVNTKFKDSIFYGLDNQENPIDKPIFDIINEWSQADLKNYIDKAFLGKTVVTEKQINSGRKDATFEISFAPIYRGNATSPTGCTISIKDVTELSITHRLLYEAKSEAIGAAQSKADFLSTMSHEIRTPMNAVIGLTNLLINDNPRDDQKEYLETIMFSGNNLLHIINDILDYNKIESGKLTLENIDFDLKDMLVKIDRTMRNKVEDKGIELNFNVDENIDAWVKGDQVRLNQVFTNLIGNAIKFTKQGGVTVNAKLLEKEEGATQRIRFEVIDTGIGIPEDKQAAVFERFTQAESNTTRNFGGTGLGLSICKKLTEAFGSKLKLKSVYGEGSNFYFDMDFEISVSPESLEVASNPEHIQKDLRGGLILLVEDNEINVLVIGEYLNQWNARFEVAENGQIALEMIEKNIYELVLMDLQMPVMDGYEATKRIRKMEDPTKANVHIYAMTADAMMEIKEKVMDAGMNGVFHKPFDPESVYRTLYRDMIGEEKGV